MIPDTPLADVANSTDTHNNNAPIQQNVSNVELLITNVLTHHWKPEPYTVPLAIVQITSQAK